MNYLPKVGDIVEWRVPGAGGPVRELGILVCKIIYVAKYEFCLEPLDWDEAHDFFVPRECSEEEWKDWLNGEMLETELERLTLVERPDPQPQGDKVSEESTANTEEQTITEAPPRPCPGWIAVAEIETQEADVLDAQIELNQNPGQMLVGGQGKKEAALLQELAKAVITTKGPDITAAIVAAIGDYTDQWYEEVASKLVDTDEQVRFVEKCPFPVGAKVYYRAEQGLNIKGLTYLQWNSPIAWEPDNAG